jgi:hypothetical protein
MFTKCARAWIHRGVDLISDALPFGRLWFGEPNALNNAIVNCQGSRYCVERPQKFSAGFETIASSLNREHEVEEFKKEDQAT